MLSGLFDLSPDGNTDSRDLISIDRDIANPNPDRESSKRTGLHDFAPQSSSVSDTQDGDVADTSSQNQTAFIRVHLNPFQENVPVQVRLFDSNKNDLESYSRNASSNPIAIAVHRQISSTMITASASGYIPSVVPITEDQATSLIDVDLYDSVHLSLQVESDWSETVPDAEVKITSVTEGIFAKTFQTDASGTLETSLPHLGEYFITVSHTNYNSYTQKRVLLHHNPNQIAIRLRSQSGSISGHVYDEKNTPLSNITVTLSHADSIPTILSSKTDESGQYHLFDVRYGKYKVGIDPGDEYVKRNIVYGENKNKNILLKTVDLDQSNPYQQIDFHTKKAVILEGIVVDETDQPIPKTVIKLAIQGGARGTAVYPTKIETLSNEEGKFRLPLTTEIRSRNQLRIGAIHPDHKYSTKTITGFAWETKPEPIKLILSQVMGRLKGKVIDVQTGEPVPDISLHIAQYAFRFRDHFIKKIVTGNAGHYQLDLPEGNYIIFDDEYSVEYPDEIQIVPEETKEHNIRVRKKEETILVKGIVKDQKGAPIHHAYLRINSTDLSDKRVGRSTVSIPDGSFQMEIPLSLLERAPQIEIEHPSYQTKSIFLKQFEDIQNIEINLDEYFGKLRVSLNNLEEASSVNMYLYKKQTMSSLKEVININSSLYTFTKLNPEDGLFFVVAGNENYFGQSEEIDLTEYPMNTASTQIELNPIQNDHNLLLTVLDSSTDDPVPIVTCKLLGITMGAYNIPKTISESSITNFEGQTEFNKLPNLSGYVEINHSNYKKYTLPMQLNSNTAQINETVRLEPITY